MENQIESLSNEIYQLRMLIIDILETSHSQPLKEWIEERLKDIEES